MVVRVRQVTRTTQPQEAVELVPSELSDAIRKPGGVVLKPLPQNKNDAARQYGFPAIGSGVSIQSGEGGLSLSFDGSNASGAFSYGNAAALACQNATSLIVQAVFSQETLANNQVLVGLWGATGDTEAFILGPAADGSITWGVYQDGSDVNICVTDPGVITAGKVYSVVCRWTGGVYTLDMWVNGVYTPLPNIAWRVGSPATNLNNSLSASAVVQFGNESSSANAFVGKIYDATVATNWTPSDDFLQSWSANPWQLFEPEQIIVPVASGTTAYTLTAATSAFTLTGTTTGLKAARKLATSVATFTETGNAAGLAVGRKLSATVSNFTLTGVAAALKADRKLAPSVSPYTLTGNDTTLTYTPTGSKLLTADTVAFTLTGSNANLTVQRKLAPSVSAFTLTGNNSALSYQRKLPAGVGSFTLTGIDVTLSTTGTELPPEQTKGGAGKAKIKKKRLKVQKRELDETLQQLIDDLTEDRNYQSSQEIIEEAVEELKENILDQIQPKELTKEEITEALVVTTVSLKLTAMEVSLSEKLDKITKELEKTNRYVQSLEELVILLNNT